MITYLISPLQRNSLVDRHVEIDEGEASLARVKDNLTGGQNVVVQTSSSDGGGKRSGSAHDHNGAHLDVGGISIGIIDNDGGEGAAQGGSLHRVRGRQEVLQVDLLAIVPEQTALGLGLRAESGKHGEGSLAALSGGHGSVLERNDRATLDVHVDGGEGGVNRLVGTASRSINIKSSGSKVVPQGLREVSVNGGDALIKHGRHKDSRANHELTLNVNSIGISGEVHPESTSDGLTGSVRLVEQGVTVREELVSHAQRVSGSLRDGVPKVELLGSSAEGVVVTRERIESSNLDPTSAQLLSGVVDESANISANHRNAEHVEVHDRDDGGLEVVPGSAVVAGPLGTVDASRQERRAREDERSLVADGGHGSIGSDLLSKTV